MSKRQLGYSLPELLAVLAIVGGVLYLGAGLGDLLEREQRFQAVLELRRALNHARTEAVVRQMPVTLCALDAGRRCAREWSGRDFAVFLDGDNNRGAAEGEILRLGHWPTERGALTWRAGLGRGYIVFGREGDTAQNGSFVFCPRSSEVATRVIVNRGGRHYMETAPHDDCAS